MCFSTKTMLVPVMLIIASITSYGQENRFSFSINSLTTNYNYGGENKNLRPYKKNSKGLQIGTAYQIGLTKFFSLVPEVNFAIKGAVLRSGNPLTASRSSVRIYSIDVPVFARLHFGQFYINAGPYAGNALGGTVKLDDSGDAPASRRKISFGNSPEDFKRWDYGFQAGMGYNFRQKRSILTLDARYGYGLANVSNDIARYNRMLNISLVVSKRKASNL